MVFDIVLKDNIFRCHYYFNRTLIILFFSPGGERAHLTRGTQVTEAFLPRNLLVDMKSSPEKNSDQLHFFCSVSQTTFLKIHFENQRNRNCGHCQFLFDKPVKKKGR